MSQRPREREDDLVSSLRRKLQLEHARVKRDRELRSNMHSTLCFNPEEHRKRVAPFVEQVEAPSTPPQPKELATPVPAPTSRCIGAVIDDGDTVEVWNRKLVESKVQAAHDLCKNSIFTGQSLPTGDGGLLMVRHGTCRSVDVEHVVDGKMRVEPLLPVVKGQARDWLKDTPVFGIAYGGELIMQSSKEPKAAWIAEADDVVSSYMRTKELYRFDGPGPPERCVIDTRRWVFAEKVGASGSLQPSLMLTEDGVERGEVFPVVSPEGGWDHVTWE